MVAVTLMLAVIAGCDSAKPVSIDQVVGTWKGEKHPSGRDIYEAAYLVITKSTMREYIKGTVDGEYMDESPGAEREFTIQGSEGNKLQLVYQLKSALSGKAKTITKTVEVLDKDRISVTGNETITYSRYNVPTLSAFKTNWRDSFARSCSGQNAAQARVDLCTCVAEKAVAALTEEQLNNQNFVMSHIKEKLVPQCQ